jgi:hypothetical protein
MTASDTIDRQIQKAGGWKSEMMSQLRTLIHRVEPGIIEEWKWDTGVYVKNGLVCAVSSFKDHVKINFFKGAALPNPHGLFNAGFESKQHRAIDFFEGDTITEALLKQLIHDAVAFNSKK